MSLKFDGKSAYILPLRNKHGLSKYSPMELLTGDESEFSFCCRIKVDWDNTDLEKTGGVIAFNGQHTGIMIRKNEAGEFFIQVDVWTENKGESEPSQIFYRLPVGYKNEWMDVVFSVDQLNKKMVLRVDEKGDVGYVSNEIIYTGNIVDYSSSLLWIGCCNALDSCPEEDRWYFTGEIGMMGFITLYLSERQAISFFKENLTEFKDNVVSYSDMKKKTYFKVFDKSGNGNHLVKYSDEWM